MATLKQENYKKLHTTANALKEANKAWLCFLTTEKYKNDSNKQSFVGSKQNALDEFEKVIFTQLPPKLSTTDLSPKILALLNAYVVMTEELFSDLPKAGTSEEEKLTGEVVINRDNLLEQIGQLQFSSGIPVSTEVVEDKIPNLTDNPCTNQFLHYLETKSAEYEQTEKLLEGRNISLTDIEIRALTNSWDVVIKNFVADARKDTSLKDPLKFGLSVTLVGFLYIHDQLETLYSRLTTNVLREESLL